MDNYSRPLTNQDEDILTVPENDGLTLIKLTFKQHSRLLKRQVSLFLFQLKACEGRNINSKGKVTNTPILKVN